MATWGVINGTGSNTFIGGATRYFPKVYWKDISESQQWRIDNNATKIRVYSLVENDGSTYDWNGTCSLWSMIVNGINRSLGSFNSNSDSGYTYPTGWTDGSNEVTTEKTELIPESGTVYQDFIIYHNPDGTKTATLSHSYSLTSGGYGPGNVSISGTIELETIPRASQPTLDDYTVFMRDQAVTINTNRASTSFTHTLEYSFGGASGIIETDVDDSAQWTPPISLASQIPSNEHATGLITCKTYSGSTLVGTKTVEIELYIPADIIPTVSIGKTGVDLLSGYYVQNKSKVAIELTEAGAYGSTISNRQTTVNGATYTGDSFTTGALKSSGTNDIDTTVTDSRNRAGVNSDSIEVVEYANPQATSLSALRCDSDGTINPEGAYMKLVGVGSISPINNVNTKNTYIQYREVGGSWLTAVSDVANYDTLLEAVVAADTTKEYEIQLIVEDYYTQSPRETSVGRAFVLANISADRTRIAFGMIADPAGALLQVADDAEFDGDISAAGGVSGASGAFTALTKNGVNVPDENHNHSLDGLLDMLISGKASGDLLQWDGSDWVNIPVSDIAEIGSNANGYYIRLSNGFQLCWKNNYIYDALTAGTHDATWTFPAEFADTPIITAMPWCQSWTEWSKIDTMTYPRTTGYYDTTYVAFKIVVNANMNYDLRADVLAIGRWFV